MSDLPARARSFPTLVVGGFALLGFSLVVAIMSLASAELENPDQAALWSTSSFVIGLVGVAAAIFGAFRARA